MIPFDLHKELDVDYAATSPNLLAAYVRIVRGEQIATQARATSQVRFVFRDLWWWWARFRYRRTQTHVQHARLHNPSLANQAGSSFLYQQAFYVIRGQGVTRSSELGEIRWKQGDLFVLPSTGLEVEHAAEEDAALYWVSDEPLLRYLGVAPCEKKFEPTLFTRERMLQHVRCVG